MNVLFVCSRNRKRSPTAGNVFAGYVGIETASAGTARDADVPASEDLIAWAEIIFVMEPVHRKRLQSMFPAQLRNKKLVVLGIPDDYELMAPDLITVLKQKVERHLRIQ